MRKTTFIISVVMLLMVGFACQQSNKAAAKLSTMESIKQLEDSLFNANTNALDKKKANELSRLYEQWAVENPADEKASDYLLKAADVAMNLNNPRRSIGLFDQILTNYPQSKNASTALFLKAFVYDDQMHDFENAGKFYNEFLEKYPESPFANDAHASLLNLGKTPEELVKEFEKNNANK
ncbi:MAG: tetratricopeptide repeat protein [Bacteroidales bacterium]|nr:tetratricopeptide repeat protein [Bacteroidales bacterium]